MSGTNTAISQLSPQPLWDWFSQICSIPHPSKHEEPLKDHIKAWAHTRSIELIEDAVGNLILRKPATAGMEDRKPVVIQAHLDMVPQANSDKIHNFVTDPIETYLIEEEEDGIVDQWVTANGTTLGADNGIGMASALAVLSSDEIPHPDLEVLLTVDEEAGMTGAFGLEAGVLNAEILINTDSEQEGEIYMGCAGGIDAETSIDMPRIEPPKHTQAFVLTVSGLKGGHSGCNIHMGRGNAINLLGRFCYAHQHDLALNVFEISGGTLRNAIPREAEVRFVLPESKIDQLKASLSDYERMIAKELAMADANVAFKLTEADAPKQVFEPTQQAKLFAYLQASPSGVIRMSDEIDGVVETSLNLGVLTTKSDKVVALSLIRSLDDSGRDNVQNMLSALAELTGARAEFSGAYPGWKPDNHSPVMAIVRDVYEGLYGKKPEIMVIHAGLECGLFKEPYPDMDMVSIGPTIRFPHSPDEKVNVRTVGLYWQLLLAILKGIPKKSSSK